MNATIEYRISEIHWIKPDPRNARTHSNKQVNQVAATIAENGFVDPILITPDGLVIAGHCRLRAAKQLGLTDLPTIALSGLSDGQDRRPRIADNKLTLNAGSCGPMEIRQRIGWNVRRLRAERELTQEDFATDRGFDCAYVSGVERGIRNPSILVLKRIADAFDVAHFLDPGAGQTYACDCQKA